MALTIGSGDFTVSAAPKDYDDEEEGGDGGERGGAGGAAGA